MAPTHPKNIEFVLKGSRKNRLVTGNVVDFILANMGQFSNLFEAISNSIFELHGDWNIVVICVPYLCHSVLFVLVCSCSVVSVV